MEEWAQRTVAERTAPFERFHDAILDRQDEILDIVEERFAVEGVGVREGVLGSAIVKGRVTELLDVQRIIADTPAPAK